MGRTHSTWTARAGTRARALRRNNGKSFPRRGLHGTAQGDTLSPSAGARDEGLPSRHSGARLRQVAWYAALLLAAVLAGGGASAWGAAEQPAAGGAATMFEKQCYSCHNIGGGKKKGPDLMGLTQRRGRDWLHRFILSPTSVKNSGDAVAVDLFREFAPEEMPDQMLTPDQIDQILGLIDQLTTQNKNFVPQSGRLARQPTADDVPAGYQLFTGQVKLAKGAPACISCHSVAGVGALGGGTLGPDLTQANLKYTDIELASILKTPAFPVMSKVFATQGLTDEEVIKLFAYLRDARMRNHDTASVAFGYAAWAAVGVLAMLALMGFAWRGRLRSNR